MEFNDGTRGKYNVGHERAKKYYNKHIEYFNTFDIIITSDTAPISRVFLQNNWNKKLIIWINNRFDYCDEATNDCNFPDEEYYTLFREAVNKDNVEIIGYTPFENFYCKNIRNIDIGDKVIKPIGCNSYMYENMNRTKVKDKSHKFFIGSYHNDNIMINLYEQLGKYNINCYKGRFNGPKDLAEYKGVIHIPYAWSNYSLFEGIQNEIIYFIPSKKFFMELKKDKDFFWSPPYRDENLELSEWYNDINKDCFIYFDSWDDLKVKTLTINYNNKKAYLKEFGNKHKNEMIKLWKEILC
tara:strand:+ start:241 stop:1131 length:891 start_codon:yes stop_codon:yes gene_type:complete